MDRYLTGPELRIGLVFVVVSMLIMTLMKKIRSLFKRNKKWAILYALFILVTFALAGLLSSSKVLNDIPANSFFGFQTIFLVLGILHLVVINRFFGSLEEKEHFWASILFTIAYLCIGLFAFLQITGRFRTDFSGVFLGASFMFVIPLLVQKLFTFAMDIPLPVFDSWTFPLGKDIKDPTKDELAHPKVISLEFKKSPSVDNITNFKVKAPQGMQFGRLFYFFIIDYNDRHVGNEIETINESNQQPYKWTFYFKPNWYSGLKHIDFNGSIADNNIKEDAVIICRRLED